VRIIRLISTAILIFVTIFGGIYTYWSRNNKFKLKKIAIIFVMTFSLHASINMIGRGFSGDDGFVLACSLSAVTIGWFVMLWFAAKEFGGGPF